MINRVHDRALRVTLGDDLSDFESLLQNNRDIRSHHKNIQSLMKKKKKELCIMVLRHLIVGLHIIVVSSTRKRLGS